MCQFERSCRLSGIRPRDISDALGVQFRQAQNYYYGQAIPRADRAIVLARMLDESVEKLWQDAF